MGTKRVCKGVEFSPIQIKIGGVERAHQATCQQGSQAGQILKSFMTSGLLMIRNMVRNATQTATVGVSSKFAIQYSCNLLKTRMVAFLNYQNATWTLVVVSSG